MGVNYEHLVLYGFRFPYEVYDREAAEDYHYRDREEGEVVVVPDGRGGEYLFIGVLQYRSEDGRNGRATIPPMAVDERSGTDDRDVAEALYEMDLISDIDRAEGMTHFVLTHFH